MVHVRHGRSERDAHPRHLALAVSRRQSDFRWPFSDYLGVANAWRLPKEGFCLLQSQWTDKPMVHIVGRWTCAGKAGGGRRVRVYSNSDTVELFLNGKSLGVKRPATSERVWKDFRDAIARYKVADQFNQRPLPGANLRHLPFIWDDVPCENGTLTAVGHKGSLTVRHSLRTPESPVRIQLKPEKQSIAADDEDVSFIEADVVDAQGVAVPDARPWIHFSEGRDGCWASRSTLMRFPASQQSTCNPPASRGNHREGHFPWAGARRGQN